MILSLGSSQKGNKKLALVYMRVYDPTSRHERRLLEI